MHAEQSLHCYNYEMRSLPDARCACRQAAWKVCHISTLFVPFCRHSEMPLKQCELSISDKACVKCWHRHGNHAYLHASQPYFTCQLTACMLGHQLFIAKYDNIHPVAHILTLFHLSAKQHACLDTGCSVQNTTTVALLSACAVVLHCTQSACSKLSSKHVCRNLTKHGAYI